MDSSVGEESIVGQIAAVVMGIYGCRVCCAKIDIEHMLNINLYLCVNGVILDSEQRWDVTAGFLHDIESSFRGDAE